MAGSFSYWVGRRLSALLFLLETSLTSTGSKQLSVP